LRALSTIATAPLPSGAWQEGEGVKEGNEDEGARGG
jgi:hypothetical protein